jgi:RimJ/RimL family protein N-acetyltransferase
MNPTTLETERLRLAPLTMADAEALRALTDDPAIIGAISFLHAPFALEDAEALIAMNSNGRDLFRGIRRREDGALMGVVGAHKRGAEIEIGYWIGTRFHGQGYASEAARAVLDRIRAEQPDATVVAECQRDNLTSWRVLEKLGFHSTGGPGARPGRLRLEWRP